MSVIINIEAQKIIPVPTREEFLEYLNGKQDSIETRLYWLAVTGKIKAYRNDSLVSILSPRATAMMGGWKRHDTSNLKYLYKHNKDSSGVLGFMPNPKFDQHKWDTLKLIPFSPTNIFSIRFVGKSRGDAFSPVGTISLKGISLVTSSVYQNSNMGFYYPLFWLKYKDIEKHLSREDLKFLNLLHHYARNSHCVNTYRNPNGVGDAFEELNNIGQIVIRPDSLFYRQLASMLLNSQFYLDGIIYPNGLSHETYEKSEFALKLKLKRIIYDDQQKKYLNIIEYQQAYWKMQGISVADISRPGEYVDSFYKVPIPLYGPDSLVYDTSTFKVTRYCYVVYHEENGARTKPVRLYLDIGINRHCENAKPIIWFYEDYIRWKYRKHI